MSISRRNLIAGAGAVLVIAACGDDSSSGSAAVTEPDPGTSGFTIAQRYPSNTFVPGKVRLPISLATKKDLLKTGPATLTGQILDGTDKPLTSVTASIHATDLVIPYWPFVVEIDEPGSFTLRIEGDDGYGAAFLVLDPAEVTVPYVGSLLPPFETPTVDDHRGVEPYCTRTPQPCPFHDVTLTEALASGKPVAYLVGTPAHCETGTCAPGLEFLIKSHDRLGDKFVGVHAEIYSDDAATKVAPAITALALDYEPIVYLCGPDGILRDRIDVIWDQSELDERLDAFLS